MACAAEPSHTLTFFGQKCWQGLGEQFWSFIVSHWWGCNRDGRPSQASGSLLVPQSSPCGPGLLIIQHPDFSADERLLRATVTHVVVLSLCVLLSSLLTDHCPASDLSAWCFRGGCISCQRFAHLSYSVFLLPKTTLGDVRHSSR